MAKKWLLAVIMAFGILFTTGSFCWARDFTVYDRQKIALRLIPFGIVDSRFYVKEVIDGRKDKSSIGYRDKESQKPLALWGDFRTSIQALSDISFRKEPDKIPIVIKINVLRLSASRGLNQYVKAEAKVAFYREKDGRLGKIYEAESYDETIDPYFAEYYGINIWNAMEKCFQLFATADWEAIEPEWEDYQKVATQSSDKDRQMIMLMPERHQVFLLEPMSVANINGWGLIRYEYDINQTGWISVHNSTTEIFTANNGSWEGTLYNFESRSGVMRRFGNSGFGILLEGGIPFGIEDNRAYIKCFLGLDFQQSLVYFPTAKQGIAATVGFYQRRLYYSDLCSSWETGMKAALGFQF